MLGTDLRLCRFFGLSEGYWLRGQARFDTETTKDRLAAELAKIKPWVSDNAQAIA
jgi:antitoxin HigA-1